MCYECAELAGEAGFEDGLEQGRSRMLEEILERAEEFEAKMRKRRYFNNANGVKRFVEYLKETVK